MKKWTTILFILLLIAGLLIRLLYANDALWYDEACSWVIAKKSLSDIMNSLINEDLQHTPLYFFLLHFWLKVFGDTEFVLRILSLIFGILTIPLGFVVTKKFFHEKLPYWVMAILCLSPVLIIFSVEVRMYSMVIFLVLMSLNYLIDYENNDKISSLIKMGIVNILIPYTFVGGILYNISLGFCYLIYLIKNKQNNVKTYVKELISEFILLIPFIALIGYYAVQRIHFVIQHEGNTSFFNVVDIIRNMFGTSIVPNIYWPSTSPYEPTFWFCLSVIVPCVYFIYGLVHCAKNSDKFKKILCYIFILNFVLFCITSFLKINVCTVRYILYVLPPLVILSTIGLYTKLSKKHFAIFMSLYLLFSLTFDIHFAKQFSKMKDAALRTVKLEADKLKLNVDDIIIMPFGGDSPYYFRDLTSARVYPYDIHKVARNPHNKIFYGDTDVMLTENKYDYIYKKAFEDKVLSDSYFNYFVNNINRTVPKGRYVLLALYASDAQAMIPIEIFRKSIPDVDYVKNNMLDVIFQKSLLDTRAMLNIDFNFIGIEKAGNYTFYIYQKR